MRIPDSSTHKHQELNRRCFLGLGGAGAAMWSASSLSAADEDQLRDAVAKLEYLTPVGKGRILDKAKAGVLSFSPEKLKEVGLTPETWSLEVVADTASGSVIEQPLTRASDNALDWSGLMQLAEKHAIRFLHPCTCTNVDDPFHVDLWEGIPLREVVWMAKPQGAIRRVYCQSYHPDNLQPFQASLPLATRWKNRRARYRRCSPTK